MSFLKNIFGSQKEEPISNYTDFWQWFQLNEKMFRKTIGNAQRMEQEFFNKLSPKLDQLHKDIYMLAGMSDAGTVELILTPEGRIHNFVFVEDLVAAAPPIDGWKFTALKPALGFQGMAIKMGAYSFNENTLSFYSNDDPNYPDMIDITIVHTDYRENNKQEIMNGVFIYLDNVLGEEKSILVLDNVDFASRPPQGKELIPITKLVDYITWREKEFVEKYEATWFEVGDGNYAIMEGINPAGEKIIASMNTELLDWDAKASHPWILHLEVKYDGRSRNGMPDEETISLTNDIVDEMSDQLKDKEGYLWVGRKTGMNSREIYFACKEFRKPSRMAYAIQQKYSKQLHLEYTIFKDKYWFSLKQYRNHN
ncbi:MAG: DUF695 domain-containing protein [Bacteroidetes bacterium]|nr:DUF695 domain-containing protein [Bacteroidota bacterium]